MTERYIIKLPPVTKKNHQRILKNKRTGALFIAPSPQYSEYAKQAGWFLKRAEPIQEAVTVRCLFYMGRRYQVDLTNLLEAADDVLVSCGILADDNYKIIASHDGSRVLYDKENPRTEIYIRDFAEGENGQT